MSDATAETRCGFVALIGAPNAGKSTLLNALVGTKIAIVTPKVQTTRTRMLGVAIEGESQIVYIDTPGIFAPKRRLDRAMVATAWQGSSDADLTLWLVDAKRGLVEEVRRIAEALSEQNRRVTLVLTKTDLIKPDALLPLSAALNELAPIDQTYMISAPKGDGLEDLRQLLAQSMPVGPWHFPEDTLTDQASRILAAEMTREALFLKLHQELPYGIAVETESWEEKPDGSARIQQVIYVQRENHKRMVIGKGASMIKAVGEASRKEIEALLDRKVHLFLHVKVQENWADDPDHYNAIGLPFNV
ncbi:MAG: GTPase Era [Alphaproteobacteria bacterium]|nr:GTPase Era [Alphaproteobacteria bacterium]MAS46234.1 GTPase Era [Alphaproteobacteria bacterium]MAX95581.1 GTPase Era [Alphaproteobacteria bacterium]MBN54281.1 GTPase Era [Alphaproteobacteria bacterium]OUT42150.1 MAG: GTPase Era [Micavibrio sp. TMED2]|tara:strand:- start:22432 stop:23340 length:909 start_codon:yes stop_codon:yes gene_type:complete